MNKATAGKKGISFGIFVLLLLIATRPITAQAADIPRYEIFEAELTSSKTYSNPFMDVTVTATFTAPSGRKLKAYGFYDGESNWRVRLAPDEVGTWSYVTTASDTTNTGLHNKTGTFTCVASSNKGFIRVDPKRKYYFSFSDGTPFFPLGNLCSLTNSTLSDANRRAYLDARAGKPFNYVRLLSVQAFNAWTDEPELRGADGWPWGGTPKAPNYDRLNPAFFRRFERILGELKARGMYAEVVVFNYYEPPFEDTNLWNAARENLWLRYLISRLAADTTVFLWNVVLEYERYPGREGYTYQPEDIIWVRRMGDLIHDTDPYKHPVNTQGSGRTQEEIEGGKSGKRLGSAPEIDVLDHQHNAKSTRIWVPTPLPGYWDGPALGVEKAVWADRVYNKPVLVSDNYHEWLRGHPTNFNKQAMSTDMCRSAAWRIFTAGAAGLSFIFSGTWLAADEARTYYRKEGLKVAPFVIADMGLVRQLGYLYDFVTRRTRFQDMDPAQSLVNSPNLCLANPGEEYVVYAPSGGSITLNLSAAPGTFSVEWLNPRTGVYQGQTTVQGGASRTFSSPDGNDWVLHLKRRAAVLPFCLR